MEVEFIPYKANEILDDVYYQVPVELFINPLYKNLSSDSKLLYAFLRYRHQLSAINNWIDENGNIYLIFPRKELQEKLNLSDKTVTKAFKQLANVKLIYEKRQGKNKPNLIYIGKINHISQSKIVNRKNSDSRIVNSTTQDTENLRPNYKYINNNKRNNNMQNSKNSYRNYEQRQYDNLDFLYANNNWDNLYDN